MAQEVHDEEEKVAELVARERANGYYEDDDQGPNPPRPQRTRLRAKLDYLSEITRIREQLEVGVDDEQLAVLRNRVKFLMDALEEF